MRSELPQDEQQGLDKTLWPFRTAAADRTAAEQARLDGLLALSGPRQPAYQQREDLPTIFDTARAKADALRRIR
ncbi:MAG: hypothetical protein H7Z42_15360 [Roseiflexaceae bacterium]|nr:hypothetical protein [Roseiflexaceae bacterium]